MFGRIGVPELILILVVALMIFGPAKLPEIGRSIGRSLREFRKASSELKESISLEDEENKSTQEKNSESTAAQRQQEEKKETDAAEKQAGE